MKLGGQALAWLFLDVNLEEPANVHLEKRHTTRLAFRNWRCGSWSKFRRGGPQPYGLFVISVVFSGPLHRLPSPAGA